MSATTPFIGIRYTPLLEMVLAHEYYDQLYCPHVTLEPSPACAQVLQAYRLRFLATPQGGRLMGQTPAVVALPSGALVLDFYLRLRDSEFLAVTAMGSGPQDEVASYLFHHRAGAWVAPLGERMQQPLPAGVRALIRFEVNLATGTPVTVQLPLETPTVSWRYYIVTGAQYATTSLQIAENSTVVSQVPTTTAPEAAQVAQRFPDKKVTALSVTMKLKKDFPAWYLVSIENSTITHVADVPPLPKPRPGTLPHLILDYSSILK
jgi:hypothetical protein